MKYIQKQRLKYSFLAITSFSLSATLFILIFKYINNLKDFGILTVLYFLHFTLLLHALKSQNKFKAFDLGSIGEHLVIQTLKKLPEAQVINSVILPNMNGNIDHVVIHLGTIFLIETKHYSKEWKVNKRLISQRMDKLTEYLKAKDLLNNNDIHKLLVYTGKFSNTNLSKDLKEVPLSKLSFQIRQFTRPSNIETAQLIKKELRKYGNR